MHYKQELELKDKELTEIKREMQDKTLDCESIKGRLENAHADLQECRERIAELLESHVSRATMKKALQISASTHSRQLSFTDNLGSRRKK